jgi:hypothetical protein
MRQRTRRLSRLLPVLLLASCGGVAVAQVAHHPASTKAHSPHTRRAARAAVASSRAQSSSVPLIVGNPAAPGSSFSPAVDLAGQPVIDIAASGGVTLMRIAQTHTHLVLHAGSTDPGGSGWHDGDTIDAAEIHTVVAAFNGGFRLSTGAGGFVSYGRVGSPLRTGVGSIVTYRDGRTDIGAWNEGVPAAGVAIASVRQNLPLLVNGGRVAGTASTCPLTCWGATIGGRLIVARSALGITSSGSLVWAGGENLSVQSLGLALVSAGVVRAVQLDINPDWVAAYLYRHGGSPLVAIPLVPGQLGIAGQYLTPESRDFFTLDVTP